jgi:hypothetical protein
MQMLSASVSLFHEKGCSMANCNTTQCTPYSWGRNIAEAGEGVVDLL